MDKKLIFLYPHDYFNEVTVKGDEFSLDIVHGDEIRIFNKKHICEDMLMDIVFETPA